jgi:hypothetical protein
MDKMKEVTLDTFQHGAVLDLFDDEMKAVIANIADINTDPAAVRKVTIELSIKPDKTRRNAEVTLKVTSKLAHTKPQASFMFFDRVDGKLVALEDEPGPELQFPEQKAE